MGTPGLVDGSTDFLAGGGEMGERIRAFDWSKTPLGPVASWPQSLRSAVSILLPSRHRSSSSGARSSSRSTTTPTAPVFGAKHPVVLGLPAREAWSEIWETGLRDLFEGVLRTGEAFWASDRPFVMERFGFPEETYFDVSYDPVRDESGRSAASSASSPRRPAGSSASAGCGRCASWRRGRPRARSRPRRRAGPPPTSRREPARPAVRPALPARRGRAARRGSPERPGSRTQSLAARPSSTSWRRPRTGSRGRSAGCLETGRAEVVTGCRHAARPAAGRRVAGAAARAPSCCRSRSRARTPRRVPGGRRQPPPAAGRRLPGLPRPAGRPRRHRRRQRPAYEEERRRAEALAELDRAKTAFFSNVSHEFRTPLTLMLGPGRGPARRGATPTAAGRRGPARGRQPQRPAAAAAGQHAAGLLPHRGGPGPGHVSSRPTSPPSPPTSPASSARPCERAGLRLTVDCPPLGEPVFVDRDMWEKIVLNLLSNAFKFTFEGEIVVTLRQAGRRAELRVRDTGTGIPAEEMPRLFERFHRVENARGRTHEGSGIGLALVQELVKLHGGADRRRERRRGGHDVHRHRPAGDRPTCRPTRSARAAPTASTATGAGPYVEEALRWLPDDEHAETRSASNCRRITRRCRSRPPSRSRRTTTGPACWSPTTTPTCGSTSSACWPSATRSRPWRTARRRWRRHGSSPRTWS